MENPRKCSLCPNEGEMSHVDNPAMRACADCRKRMDTEIPIVCTGCDVVWWLPKTPQNVVIASQKFGKPPQEVMDCPVLGAVKSCRLCGRGGGRLDG